VNTTPRQAEVMPFGSLTPVPVNFVITLVDATDRKYGPLLL